MPLVLSHGADGVQLRHEASVSIQAMNAALPGSFDDIFVKRVAEMLVRFDSILTYLPQSMLWC